MYRILICIFFLFSYFLTVSANSLENVFQNFLSKIEKKYSPERQIEILNLLAQKIDEKQNMNISAGQRDILRSLETLNNSSLFSKQKNKILSENIAVSPDSNITNFGKTSYYELRDEMRGVMTPDWRILEENDIYYGVQFENLMYFEDSYGVSRANLTANNIDSQKDFLYIDEGGRNNFVNQYTLTKLGSRSLFDSQANALELVSLLQRDGEYRGYDIAPVWRKILFTTRKLEGKNDEETIQNIYAWILENISYTANINTSHKNIFSGIATFESKSGVCSGYTRLFTYMLSLAGIHDVEVIEGHVIDAPDFPQIAHAWVRVGDRYYDPTFDDPVGAKFTKTPEEYAFFGLPKDIFYANRYEYNELPLALKVAKKQEITKHVHDRLKRLLPKYRREIQNYPVFYPVLFREKYSISPLTKITPTVLSKNIPYYRVENNSFRYQKNGKTVQLLELEYYVLDDENTQTILDLFEYNEKKFDLIYWQRADGVLEWRLVYNTRER